MDFNCDLQIEIEIWQLEICRKFGNLGEKIGNFERIWKYVKIFGKNGKVGKNWEFGKKSRNLEKIW